MYVGGNRTTLQAPGNTIFHFLTGTKSFPLAKAGMAAYIIQLLRKLQSNNPTCLELNILKIHPCTRTHTDTKPLTEPQAHFECEVIFHYNTATQSSNTPKLSTMTERRVKSTDVLHYLASTKISPLLQFVARVRGSTGKRV